MTEYLINNTVQLSCPEGFHEMDSDELRQVYLDDNSNRWGIWDKEKHIIISVFWHRSSGLLMKLAGDAENVAKSTEGKLRHSLKNNNYHCEGFFTLSLNGKNAAGFRYNYTVQDVKQTGDVILMLHGKECYTVYYYARKDGPESDHEIFEQVLDSIRFQ